MLYNLKSNYITPSLLNNNKQKYFNYAKFSTERSIKKLEVMYKDPNYKIRSCIVDHANHGNEKQYVIQKWHTNIFNTMAFSFSFYLVYLFYKRRQ